MKNRTAANTGRTADTLEEALRRGSFIRYAAMVERLAEGYVRPLALRLSLEAAA